MAICIKKDDELDYFAKDFIKISSAIGTDLKITHVSINVRFKISNGYLRPIDLMG